MDLKPCKYCGQIPQIINYDGDMFYVICSCGKWGDFDFLGFRKILAIKEWNLKNSGVLDDKNSKKRVGPWN